MPGPSRLPALPDVPAGRVVLQLAEMPGERELLFVGDVLVGEHQHGILVHACLDRRDLVAAERPAAVDSRDLRRECRMQLAERYRHLHRVLWRFRL